jgi:hypothetical protein
MLYFGLYLDENVLRKFERKISDIQFSDLTSSSCEKCDNIGPLAGFEPAALPVDEHEPQVLYIWSCHYKVNIKILLILLNPSN